MTTQRKLNENLEATIKHLMKESDAEHYCDQCDYKTITKGRLVNGRFKWYHFNQIYQTKWTLKSSQGKAIQVSPFQYKV